MANVYVVAGSILNGNSLTVQPSAGVEVVIHTIYYGGSIEVNRVNASGTIAACDSDTGAGVMRGLTYHCTNTNYITIKNVSGGTIVIEADGMQTK